MRIHIRIWYLIILLRVYAIKLIYLIRLLRLLNSEELELLGFKLTKNLLIKGSHILT